MRKKILKGLGAVALVLCLSVGLAAAELRAIKLNPPDLKRGLPLMEVLAIRASVREFQKKSEPAGPLRPAMGRRRHEPPGREQEHGPVGDERPDIRIYVFTKDGAYLYDSPKHELLPVLAGDFRSQLMAARPAGRPPPAPAQPPRLFPPRERRRPASHTSAAPSAPPPPPSNPPVQIVLVSDGERFSRGDPERKFEWGALDAGIVSQNISLFCAATGLKTVPRAMMDKARIKELLKLTDTQIVFLNHPVGYAK